MSATQLDQIRRRFSNAYRARDYQLAAQIAAEGAHLAETLGDRAAQTRMLVWQGESHWQRRETEPAVAALSIAAAAEAPADPVDVFSAISTLLSIAILERPLAEASALLEQGRSLIGRSPQLRCGHMLELSEGDLAARRGDWLQAQRHYRAAHRDQEGDDGSPRFTLTSYQIKLASAAFMLGDAAELGRWCRLIDAAPKSVEGDRLRAEQARLLCYRAGLGEPAGARGGAATTARRVLRWLEELDGHQHDLARDAMLVLLQEGDWLSVETWLEYPGIGDDPLMRGDLHLARARAALGEPARDPDWPGAAGGTRGLTPLPNQSPSQAPNRGQKQAPKQIAARRRNKIADDLEAARAHYGAQRGWAEREDQRLQTDHHHRLLEARLEQVEALSRSMP